MLVKCEHCGRDTNVNMGKILATTRTTEERRAVALAMTKDPSIQFGKGRLGFKDKVPRTRRSPAEMEAGMPAGSLPRKYPPKRVRAMEDGSIVVEAAAT